jgi:hypothetical protein
MLGHAVDQLAPIRGEIVASLGEQSIGSASAIAIDDDAAHLLRDSDERQALDAAQGPGRGAKPFHRRQGPSAKPSSSVAEASRIAAVPRKAKRDFGLRHRLVQHVVGIEERALHRDNAEVVLDGRDHNGDRPLGRAESVDDRGVEAQRLGKRAGEPRVRRYSSASVPAIG